jgi:hypothetical protein
VEVPRLRERLRRLLTTYLEDNRQAWELDSEGRYTQRRPDGEERASQARLLVESWGGEEGAGRRDEGMTDAARTDEWWSGERLTGD